MPNLEKKPSKILIAAAVVVFLTAIGMVLFYWLVRGGLTNSKVKILSVVPLPVASINGKPMVFKDFWSYYELSQKFFSSSIKPTKEEALNLYLDQQKNLIIAEAAGVKINTAETSEVFKTMLEGKNQIQNLGLTENDFKSKVLYHQMALEKLKIWFNSKPDYNPEVYKKLNGLEEKLKAGENFSGLAEIYSQDLASKNLGGDLGFVRLAQILPEMRPVIKSMVLGEVKIIPSNLGVHLVKLAEKRSLENSNEEFHLRQIFLKTSGFETWLEKQKSNLKVKLYITL